MLSLREWTAFGLTVALEWPICALLTTLGLRHTALFCLFVNTTTWFALTGVLASLDAHVPLLEMIVIGVEAWAIRWCFELSLQRALLTSAAMNLTSWLLGLVLLEELWSAA